MILIVVAAFTISWTPYFVITTITQYSSVNYMRNHNFFFTMLSINLFAFLNSSVNPFIYAIMSSRFRTGFVSILRFIFCASDSTSINGSNPINSNQMINNNQTPPDHRFRGRSAIARYHRQMVLMVCRGPTQVSTDSLPPTDSPHFMNANDQNNYNQTNCVISNHCNDGGCYEMNQLANGHDGCTNRVTANSKNSNSSTKGINNELVTNFVTNEPFTNVTSVVISNNDHDTAMNNHVTLHQTTTVHLTLLSGNDDADDANKDATSDRKIDHNSDRNDSDPLNRCPLMDIDNDSVGRNGVLAKGIMAIAKDDDDDSLAKENSAKEVEKRNEGRVQIAGEFFSMSDSE